MESGVNVKELRVWLCRRRKREKVWEAGKRANLINRTDRRQSRGLTTPVQVLRSVFLSATRLCLASFLKFLRNSRTIFTHQRGAPILTRLRISFQRSLIL